MEETEEETQVPDFLNLECDEDGTYIVTDNSTIVYGDGDSPIEAFHDYILSLIEYAQLLLPKTVKASGGRARGGPVSALGRQ